jgi:hypothetical protein
VKSDWYQREGDRRLQVLVQQLQSRTIVNVNEAALAKIGRRERPGARHGRPR